MNTNKIFAGIISLCLVAGALPTSQAIIPDFSITANAEEEYIEGTYGDLEYYAYSDHIEISGCDKNATSVDIPNEIDGLPVTSIGDFAFSYCASLTSIIIPDGVTSIRDFAFSYCASLTSIIIPDGVTSIGVNVFLYCSSLTEIIIPDSVTSISDYAFHNCTGLKEINVSSQNENYTSQDGVFFNKNKTELIAYPAASTRTSYEIPDSVTSIGNSAFVQCESITSITISDSVTSIGDSAFKGCRRLTSITIPDSVMNIGSWAFSYCESLRASLKTPVQKRENMI